MKNFTLKMGLLLLVLLFTGFVNVKAQPPFVYQDGQQWNILSGSVYGTQKITRVFHANDNYASCMGTTYKILYVDYDDILDFYYGLFRENDGKVYYRDIDHNQNVSQEYLIYDWTMEVGDRVEVRYGESARSLVLDQITETILNSTNRRVFHLHYETDPELTEIWIEGLGSELGFPFSGTKNNPESQIVDAALLCYYENGAQIWDNPEYDACYMNYWDIDEYFSDDINVYPNPTNGKTTVKLIGQEEKTVEIYDMMGKMVMRCFRTGDSFTIDLNRLPEGLYNILIYDDLKTHYTKIIKH